jgi:hypothetical protein
MCPIFIGQCVQYLLDKVFLSLVKDPNLQDFFALVIICQIFFHLNLILSKKYGLSGTGGASGANFMEPWMEGLGVIRLA